MSYENLKQILGIFELLKLSNSGMIVNFDIVVRVPSPT